MFATAVLADAKRKNDRLELWDKKIEDARMQLDYREETMSIDLHELPGNAVVPANQQSTRNSSIELKNMGTRRTQPSGTTTAYVSILFDNIQPKARPLTARHRTALENAVARLVFRLLQLFLRPRFQERDSLLLEEVVIGNLRKIKGMKTVLASMQRLNRSYLGDYWTMPYPIYEETTSALKIFKQRHSLAQIFYSHGQNGTLGIYILHLCHQLLTSNTPPDIETYQRILKDLSSFPGYDHFILAMTSLIESRLLPNEKIAFITLRFLAHSKDSQGFVRFVRRMEGYDGGLTYGRWRASDLFSKGTHNEYDIDLSTWHKWLKPSVRALYDKDTTATYQDGAVVIKAPQNPQILRMIVTGFLNHGKIVEARQYFRKIISKGYEIDIQILHRFLSYADGTQNWQLGKQTWDRMMTRASEKVEQFVGVRSYARMLRLCQNCGKFEEFRKLYKIARRYCYDTSEDIIKHLKNNPLSQSTDPYEWSRRVHHLERMAEFWRVDGARILNLPMARQLETSLEFHLELLRDGRQMGLGIVDLGEICDRVVSCSQAELHSIYCQIHGHQPRFIIPTSISRYKTGISGPKLDLITQSNEDPTIRNLSLLVEVYHQRCQEIVKLVFDILGGMLSEEVNMAVQKMDEHFQKKSK
ncbi:MAG: hypothetical protein M1829_003021 [Trizodia sp. TS-e1964]|nr:MAG: hypothetical protein M1829_003021 [Trizodia sp. TS-e1964]